jgi:ABC-type nitrate/sulfonate/bicarbonate transport system substrate-binding protein
MTRLGRRDLLLGLIASTAASVCTPEVAEAQTSLKVITFPGMSNLALFAAQKQGYFTKRGLAVEVTNTPNSEVLRTGLAKGEFQVAHAAVDNAVDMADVGKVDIAIVMGRDGGFNELIVQPEINSYDDLRGKTVIVDAPDTAYALLLYKMLEIKGLKKGDYVVKPVGGSFRRYEVMVQDKNYAASMLNPPFSIRAVKDGLKSLGSSAEVTGPYQAGGAFVLRAWGEANAETLVKYIQALVEGLRWAMSPANKAEVIAMISERLKLPQDIATKSYEISVDPHKGFTKDAKLELEGFRNTLKLRAEILRTPGTDPARPEKYLDLSHYQRAIAGLQ